MWGVKWGQIIIYYCSHPRNHVCRGLRALCVVSWFRDCLPPCMLHRIYYFSHFCRITLQLPVYLCIEQGQAWQLSVVCLSLHIGKCIRVICDWSGKGVLAPLFGNVGNKVCTVCTAALQPAHPIPNLPGQGCPALKTTEMSYALTCDVDSGYQ